MNLFVSAVSQGKRPNHQTRMGLGLRVMAMHQQINLRDFCPMNSSAADISSNIRHFPATFMLLKASHTKRQHARERQETAKAQRS